MVMELVLIKAPARIQWEIVERAKKLKGVLDAYPVFGRFDIVVLIRGRNFEEIRGIKARVAAIEGIKNTETLPESD